MIFLIVSISVVFCPFSVEQVTGSINGTVMLPCNYPTTKGTYTMCWGRDTCSTLQFYCTSKIIETGGEKVTWSKSDRYQLPGNISLGNVSLMITWATKEDEGPYCCQVEIPGPFNDKMVDVTLKIEKDHEDDHGLQNRPLIPWTFTISTQTLSPTSESQNMKNETYIFLIFVILAAILLAVILYIYKFKKRKSLVRTEPTTELNNLRSPVNHTVENVYIMD